MTQDRKLRKEMADLDQGLNMLKEKNKNKNPSEVTQEDLDRVYKLEYDLSELRKKWNKEKYLHATHYVDVKFYCPNLDKEITFTMKKIELDKDVVWFEAYREFIHKNVPYGTPRIYYPCECGDNHEVLVDDWKFTGLKEALSMTAEEWEKLYE